MPGCLVRHPNVLMVFVYSMLNWLSRPVVLWALFGTTVAATYGFVLWTPFVGGVVLDTIFSPTTAERVITGMSDRQRWSHLWMTVTLDSVYPLLYGSLCIGITNRAFARHGRMLCLFVLTGVFFDFAENAVQALALTGPNSMLWAKAFLTPAKFGFVYLGFAISALGVVALISQYIRTRFRS